MEDKSTWSGRTPEIAATSNLNAFNIPWDMSESEAKIRDKAFVLSFSVIEYDHPIGADGCTNAGVGKDAHFPAIPNAFAAQKFGRFDSETVQAVIAAFARAQHVPIVLAFTADPLAGDKAYMSQAAFIASIALEHTPVLPTHAGGVLQVSNSFRVKLFTTPEGA